MRCLKIKQTDGLYGNVRIQGSKNAVLPIMAASLLSQGPVVLENCPDILDVRMMESLLEDLGAKIDFSEERMTIWPPEIPKCMPSSEKICRLRASVLLMGAMLGRWGKAGLGYPGGCAIGRRPIDQHLKKLKEIGFTVISDAGHIDASGRPDGDCRIRLDFPSVGVTENIILSRVVSKGTTIIEGAAREPEICHLCDFLRQSGADIEGEGGHIIRVRGVGVLGPCHYRVPGDRIVAGTYAIAAAAVGSDVRIEGFIPEENHVLWNILKDMGVTLGKTKDSVRIISPGGKILKNPEYVATAPYPDFSTDLQSPFLVLMAVSGGKCRLKETIFENRFHIVDELNRMGAGLIKESADTVAIPGKACLNGCFVSGKDLRGSAALAIAGLLSEGETHLTGIENLKRGYRSFDQDFRALGAFIEEI